MNPIENVKGGSLAPRFLFVVILLILVACAAPSMPTATPVPPTAPSVAVVKPTSAPTQPASANAASCATTKAAPPDQFRSDDPKKLEASAKPKLVEFFAFW